MCIFDPLKCSQVLHSAAMLPVLFEKKGSCHGLSLSCSALLSFSRRKDIYPDSGQYQGLKITEKRYILYMPYCPASQELQ